MSVIESLLERDIFAIKRYTKVRYGFQVAGEVCRKRVDFRVKVYQSVVVEDRKAKCSVEVG